MDRLSVVGLITAAEAEELASGWELPEKRLSAPERTTTRTHFTEAVKDYLLNGSTVLGDTEQERYNALFRGGLRIHTTLDPQLQALAQAAKDAELPLNDQGIEAAVVSLDSASGAVRAMVGGQEFRQGVNEINLALRARQSGSAIKIFILAAAVQAGALPTDIIDGTLPCTLPNPGNLKDPFKITSGVTKAPATLQEMTWSSINCAFARLSQIVGLNRLVDLTARMGVASPLQPFASFATGANELTPMDMAAGAQTIANQGLHHDPYYVERIDGPSGVMYQHVSFGTRVLTPEAANTTVSILKGVLQRGTARRIGFLSEGDRPAAGKTGTQDDNTNAWFVGFTPQLTTAVWVGDPKGYTPLNTTTVPKFRPALAELGKSTVQGATFPLSIWAAFMEPALVFEPILDWPAPPEPYRRPARLYLPGADCLASNGAAPEPRGSTTTVVDPVEVTVPQLRPVDPGTTIAPDVLDPLAPLPTVPLVGIVVYDCARGLPVPVTTVPPVTPGDAPPTTSGESPETSASPPVTAAPEPETTGG
jgi:penicillin-binding protein 1A